MKISNTSKIYYDESVWDTIMGGKLIIIGKSKKKDYYICKFLEGGEILESHSTNIKNGNIRNINYKTVCGIGFIGKGIWEISKNRKHTKEYALWTRILNRCYSSDERYNKTYKNCTVDERWHNFQNFCDDIQHLEGYEEWFEDTNKINIYHLDKDIKQPNIENKIYSKNTCIFVLDRENYKEKNSRFLNLSGKNYIAVRLIDNYIEEFTNQAEFARKWNLDQPTITNCLNNKRIKHKGWIFKVKEEKIND